MELIVIDLFCGAGGVSTGFEMAELNGHKVAKVIACVNHDEMAIESHLANHPDAVHFTEDIKLIDMPHLKQLVDEARLQYPDAYLVLWASLECTNFSKAKGGLPRDADSRSLADFMPWYVTSLQPDFVMIENVIEFMAWGPLDENGKPVSKTSGTDYMRWVNVMKQLNNGYEYDWRELNSADYGAYTSRKRFFGVFAAAGLPIVWPQATHSKKPVAGDMFLQAEKWKAVKDVLDLNNLGESIFTRKKPLSEKTLERVYAGLIKFVAGGKDAFIAKYYSGRPEGKVKGIDEPCDVIRTSDCHALVQTQFLSTYHGNGANCHNVDNPAPTIPTHDSVAQVTAQYIMRDFTSGGSSHSINNPAGALMASPKMNLVSPVPFIHDSNFNNKGADVNQPHPTITANRKWHYLVNPLLLNHNSSTAPVTDASQPAPTVTAVRTHYIVNPQWFNTNPGSVDEPHATIIARQDKTPTYLTTAENGDVCILVYDTDTEMVVKIKEFMALYGIADIFMRMLTIPELLRIQGFPAGYILKGTQTQQKKYIGNSVVPQVVKSMAEALAGKLMESERRAA